MKRSSSRTSSWSRPGAPPESRPAPDTAWDLPWDVAVLGGGNAALVSALTAADNGARVLLLERAPAVFRGGNSRHTRNVRCAHDAADDYVTGPYPGPELRRDLDGVGTGPSDEALADLTIAESHSVPGWMSEHGARWQPALRGTLGLARTNRFFLGGGKALLNSYYRTAQRAGITVRYDARVLGLEWSGEGGGTCAAVIVDTPGGTRRVTAKAVVAASGGFEANIDWLARYWGDAARNYHVRGPRYNDGAVLDLLLRGGAERAGEERGFHAVAVDARSPKFDGGIATRLDAIPFGIVVNAAGRRFYDEGEDVWPKRYAIWGGNLAGQPGQIGYALWDARVHGQFLPPMYGAYRDGTLAGLSRQLGLDPRAVAATVDAFNAAVDRGPGGDFTMAGKDGRRTEGVDPPKSNWAQRLDTPPFYGVPMRPGITFTYLGVAVTERARVRTAAGGTFGNLFAAGEIMSGNILSSGYLAGFGMTIGTVWGRIAGREAARHARG
jgi:tricarballylate dehydrogenase